MNAYKIVILGDSSVGKTSIITRLVSKKFIEYMTPTLGAGFTSYVLNQNVRLNIWDTAGQERYRTMVHIYYRNAQFALLVFDITSYKIEDIEYWIDEFIQNSNIKNPKFILIGNKSDLLDANTSLMDIDELSKKYNVKFFKTSARNGSNIDEIFEYVANQLDDTPTDENKNIILDNKESSRKRCC